MNCMKCGREIPAGQVFCPACLEVMERYPVAPGTHVRLARRPARNQEKKVKEVPPQTQIAALKKRVRWLWVTVAILIAACGLLALLLIHHMQDATPKTPTGRNYTNAPNMER